MVQSLALKAEHLSKSFSGVQALDDVSFELPYGSVTALMGENGAGKSTLLKILSGDYRPDGGQLTIDGQPVQMVTPQHARQAGLRVVAQEPEILPSVSVAENLYVGNLPSRGGIFREREAYRRAETDIERFGFQRMLRPETLGERLSPAQRQLVEILRCLIDEPKIICFDEPTSSLSDAETGVLFELIDTLRNEGKAIGYVSHRLKEIFQICDTVTVLRDGKLIGQREVARTQPDEVIRMMVGRDLASMHSREHYAPGAPRLQLNQVTTPDVTDVSLVVHAHEVVALAGLVGAGRTELAMAITGDVPVLSGTISVEGQPMTFSSPKAAIKAGIGLAPEERKADALVMIRSVRENMSLAVLNRLTRFGFVRQGEERSITDRYANQLRVRATALARPVENLSGGNQQKVVLARWLARESSVLVLDEPTRGVDVGAKAEIYAIIDQLAAAGAAVLVISSELPEVLGLADRIVVMQAGKITGELNHDVATEEKILALAMAADLTEELPPDALPTTDDQPSAGEQS